MTQKPRLRSLLALTLLLVFVLGFVWASQMASESMAGSKPEATPTLASPLSFLGIGGSSGDSSHVAQSCSSGDHPAVEHCYMNGVDVIKVNLNDPSITIRPVIAPNGGLASLSSLAGADGIAAINGDYRLGSCTNGVNCAEGLTYVDGNNYTMGPPDTYNYRRSLAFNQSLDPHIGFPSEQGGYLWHVIGGGPRFTENGAFRWVCGDGSQNHDCPNQGGTVVINGEYFGSSATNWWNRPQSAIGSSDDGNTIYFAASAGSVTMQTLHDVLWQLGSRNNLKLDGGSARSLYYNDGSGHYLYLGPGIAEPNAWVVLPSSVQPPTPTPAPGDGIELCTDPNYGGHCWTYTYIDDGHCFDLRDHDHNNNVSSFRFHGSYVGNYTLILYDDVGSCTGGVGRFEQDNPNLSQNTDWDNRASSMRIERRQPPVTPTATSPPTRTATPTRTYTPTPPSGPASFRLSPSSGSYSLGQQFDVDVILNSGEHGLDGYDVLMHYDAARLQVISLSPVSDPFLGSNITGDRMYFGANIGNCFTGEGFHGEKTVARIRFSVIAGGTAHVTFDFTPGATYDTNAIACDLTDVLGSVANGSYSLSGPTPEVTATSTRTLIPTSTPTHTQIPTSTPTRTSIPTPTPTATYTPAPDGIVLCEHTYWMGRCHTFTASHPDFNLINFNDIASSIRFVGSYAGQYEATIYEHTYYMGRSYSFTEDHPDFNLLGFNDIASSLVIGPPATPTPTPIVEPVAHDDFGSALCVDWLDTTYTQQTEGATVALDDPVMSCIDNRQGAGTIWYRFVSPDSGSLHLDTFGSDYDTVLAVYTGARGNLFEVDCNDDTQELQSALNIPVVAGEAYHVQVASYPGSNGGNLQLFVEYAPPPGCSQFMQNGGFEQGPGSCPWWQSSSGGYELIYPFRPRSGSYSAWLGGYDNASDVMSQIIRIPDNATSTTLTFWWYMTTSEAEASSDVVDSSKVPEPGTQSPSQGGRSPQSFEERSKSSEPHDYLEVWLWDSAHDWPIALLQTITDQSTRDTWTLSRVYPSGVVGSSYILEFKATTDASNWTSFFIDDVSRVVCTSCAFDFDGSRAVDTADIMRVASRWRTSCAKSDPDNDPNTPNYDPFYDIDEDCDIDVVDIMKVVARWGPCE